MGKLPLLVAKRVGGIIIVFASTISLLAQGSLTPPGPPAATMKTLDQIDAKLEKRTPIITLPYAITSPGAYYLTQSLNISSGSGITINVDDVSVDLNGFTITGSGSSQSGIIVSGNHRHIRVYNGSVRGFSANGVDLSAVVLGEIFSLLTSGNGGVGINGGDTVTIRDCASRENNGDNFRTGAHATISRCSAVLSATGHGFNVTEDCHLSDCVSDSNQRGYMTTDGASITNCVARANKDYGIFTGAGSVISNSTASAQTGGFGIGIRVGDGSVVTGCSAAGNGGDGIQTTSYCLVTQNTSANNGLIPPNGAIGIHLFGLDNRIDGNIASHNFGTGIRSEQNQDVTSDPDVIVRNTAHSNLINYSPSSHAYLGATGQTPNTSTNPWANF